MTKKEIVRALIEGINRDISGYNKLAKLLEMQRQLMLDRDNDKLSEHSQQQQALCELLKKNAVYRSQLLSNLGLPANNIGMERLINALPAPGKGKALILWQGLVSQIEHSQQLNDANGELLAGQMQVINKLLNIKDSSTYTSNE
ncbi:flagellar protein FlgN [Shewanella sp. 202IG2-18]|uniref:flagellar protein FlgN n=1 Tax=Parashewanella hymeniacidonis TaxID=2807618 RepID=UPI00195F620E|nr:flagellar protein FlgN [Parashewanella hymeniacidonis]MBM7072866.1 flagellar protein FlgN [Parashewanella hymeniacidonis]